MLLTRQVLDRTLQWGAVVIFGGMVLNASMIQMLRPIPYPAELLALVGFLAAGAFVWCVMDAVTSSPRRTGVRCAVGVALTAGIIQGLGGYFNPSAPAQPTFAYLLSGGVGLCGYAFARRHSAVVLVLLSASFAWDNWPILPPMDCVLVSSLQLIAGTVTILVVPLLIDMADEVERSLAAAWSEREELDREHRRAAEQQRWDGLVHDKVLGALLLGGRGTGPVERAAATELAGEASDAAASPITAESQSHLAASIAAAIDRLGLTLEVDIEDTMSEGPHREAIRGAMEAVLSNVARHSGARSASVAGSVSDLGGSVTIRDHGSGFDPKQPRPGKAGIDLSIRARMDQIGGSARIESAPGAGTTVTLVLPDVRDASTTTPIGDWRATRFTPLAALGLAAVAVHVIMAIRHGEQTRSLPWLAVTVTLVILLTIWVLVTPLEHPRWALPAVIACAILPGLATLNISHPDHAGWGYWFVGTLDTALCFIAVRARPSWAIGVAVIAPAGIGIAQHSRGAASAVMVGEGLTQLLVFAAAASVVRIAMDTATAYVNQETAREGAFRIARSQLDEVRSVAAARTRALGAQVNAMLVRLARGDDLTAEDRAECLALEAAARDGLVAAPLLTPELAQRLRTARDHGVRVDMTAEDGHPQGIAEFRELIEVALRYALPSCTVRVLWRPDKKGRLGSISVVGPYTPNAVPELHAIAQGAAHGFDLNVLADEDSLLFELSTSRVRAG